MPPAAPPNRDVLLDDHEPARVSIPLMPEFAIVSTLALVAAPIVLVGATVVLSLRRGTRVSRAAGQAEGAEGAGQSTTD